MRNDLRGRRLLAAWMPSAPRIPGAAWMRMLTAAWLLGAVGALPARAKDPVPASARAAFSLAREAAQAWSAEATLIYLENDEDVDASGASLRWGFLFYSPEMEDTRAYSISGGEIVATLDPAFKFDAPPLPESWLDSGDALRVAQEKVREQGLGLPESMVLLRGAFDDKKPDRTCWLVCFRQEGAPAMFVLVDSAEARVVRTWRG